MTLALDSDLSPLNRILVYDAVNEIYSFDDVSTEALQFTFFAHTPKNYMCIS